MSPSSTFNFESIRTVRPRLPATLLAVALLIAGLELALRLIPDRNLFPSSRTRLGVATFFEDVVIPKAQHPKILVMGSSRAEDAVVPRRLDRALGLAPNSTLNLGMQGGRPFDALWLYQRNQQRLKEARLILLFLDEWQFSSGWGLGARYALHAPLVERLKMVQDTPRAQRLPPPGLSQADWETRQLQQRQQKREALLALQTCLLTDLVFTMRLKLRYLPSAIAINLLGLGEKKGLRLDENNQVIRPENEHQLAYGPPIRDPRQMHERIHGFYLGFDSHPILKGHVEQLLALARANGTRVVLVHMPNRAIHQEEVQKLYGPEFELYLQTIDTLCREWGNRAFVYRFPSECGLEERHFVDYGHLARVGGEVFTDFLARLIREEKLLAPPPEPQP